LRRQIGNSEIGLETRGGGERDAIDPTIAMPAG